MVKLERKELFMNGSKRKLLLICLTIIEIFFININISYAITASSELQYQGIDVSNWQGYIDYNKVKQSGVDIVYIKASQGSNIKDAYFDVNYENAKLQGLKVGFYHFLTATNERRGYTRGSIFLLSNFWRKG